jgi:hypothetical protein
MGHGAWVRARTREQGGGLPGQRGDRTAAPERLAVQPPRPGGKGDQAASPNGAHAQGPGRHARWRGPRLQARGGGEATRGAPLLCLVAHKLGQHQRALKAHQRRRALLLLQQPARAAATAFQRCSTHCSTLFTRTSRGCDVQRHPNGRLTSEVRHTLKPHMRGRTQRSRRPRGSPATRACPRPRPTWDDQQGTTCSDGRRRGAAPLALAQRRGALARLGRHVNVLVHAD